jgi:hypothetical protein
LTFALRDKATGTVALPYRGFAPVAEMPRIMKPHLGRATVPVAKNAAHRE